MVLSCLKLYNLLMIDLHVHSVYSDGTYTVEEIIKEAEKIGITQLAITDHNILDGSLLADKMVKQISNIDYIIGTELSVDYNHNEVHLLALFPKPSDYSNVQFIINEGQANKKVAILEMIENLNDMGIDIKLNELKEFAKGIINRVHICQVLMKKGYVSSINEGFEKYVGDHCPAFVERKTTPLFEAIDAVHADGGLAIIAHPFEYDGLQPIDKFLEEVIDKVDGIECFHPSATSENSKLLVEITNKHNKIITGGSDFHGANKPKIKLGMMNVDDKYKIKK